MLYKPKFCCNCGEKVERAEWPILASRRFCELCASENSEYDYFLRATAIICLISGLFGIAAFVRGSGGFGGNAESGLSIERASATRAGLEPVAGKALQKSPELMESSRPQTPNSQPVTADPKAGGIAPKAVEAVYYCGAITKKGTPCTRRVKSKGAFCWQHESKGSARVEGLEKQTLKPPQ